MRIDFYRFGKISINGTVYGNDLIIHRGNIIENWWRKNGHFLEEEDIIKYVGSNWKEGINTVIVGKGADGLMDVDVKLINRIGRDNIKYFSEKSDSACKQFNETKDKEKILFLIHLTC